MLAPDATDLGFLDVNQPFTGYDPTTAPEPAATSAAATTTTQAGPESSAARRYACEFCNKSYTRPADLRRHIPEHNPNAIRYSCPFEHCNRKGRKGFVRADKLKEHRRSTGH
jgi:uncharacterized Zn-finger protein